MVHFVRRVVFWLAVAMVFWIVGTFTRPPAGRPLPWRRELHDIRPGLKTVSEGAWTVTLLVLDHPLPVAAVCAVLLLPWLFAALRRVIPRRVYKDPQRLFTAQQRQAGSVRAGGRCEMETVWFTRCRASGAHGDHWYPHTLGGPTTLENFVWACVRCNTSKGARVPTWWETTRLEMRRRRYFADSVDPRPRRGGRAPGVAHGS